MKEIKSEPNVRALFQQICDLVQREELNASLISLDLLDNAGPSTAQASTSPLNSESSGADSLPMYLNYLYGQIYVKYIFIYPHAIGMVT